MVGKFIFKCDFALISNGSDSNNTGTMKRKKQHQQQQHCSNGHSGNGIPPQQQQKVYVSLYPQMIGAMEPNYETLSRQVRVASSHEGSSFPPRMLGLHFRNFVI